MLGRMSEVLLKLVAEVGGANAIKPTNLLFRLPFSVLTTDFDPYILSLCHPSLPLSRFSLTLQLKAKLNAPPPPSPLPRIIYLLIFTKKIQMFGGKSTFAHVVAGMK